MRFAAAFPGWISAALLVACAVTLLFAPREEGANPLAWHVLQYLLPALMLSSSVAALVTAHKIWRASKWLAAAYVLLALIASWCLYVAAVTVAAGLDRSGHPVGIVIGAVIGFLFVPVSGLAGALAAFKAEAAGLSRRAKLSGLGAGGISALGIFFVIPLSQATGGGYGASAVLLSLIGLALIGWWFETGAAAAKPSSTT